MLAADGDAVSRNVVRGAQDLDDAVRQERRVLRTMQAALHDGELVASQAGTAVKASRTQSRRRWGATERSNSYAQMVAERVVHLLETVEIEAEPEKCSPRPTRLSAWSSCMRNLRAICQVR